MLAGIQSPAGSKPLQDPNPCRIQSPAGFKPLQDSIPCRVQSPAGSKPLQGSIPCRVQSPAGFNPLQGSIPCRIQSPAGFNPLQDPIPCRVQSPAGFNPLQDPIPCRVQSPAGFNPLQGSIPCRIQSPAGFNRNKPETAKNDRKMAEKRQKMTHQGHENTHQGHENTHQGHENTHQGRENTDKPNKLNKHMKTKIDWKQYEKRVAELENEGLCRSDAQSVADVEFAEASTPTARPSGATPGPWTVSGCTVYAGDVMIGCTYCEGNRELHPVICDSELPDSTGIHGSGWDEAGANARLIAAAPDLLDALRRLTHPMASDDDLSHALALIEKVEA